MSELTKSEYSLAAENAALKAQVAEIRRQERERIATILRSLTANGGWLVGVEDAIAALESE